MGGQGCCATGPFNHGMMLLWVVGEARKRCGSGGSCVCARLVLHSGRAALSLFPKQAASGAVATKTVVSCMCRVRVIWWSPGPPLQTAAQFGKFDKFSARANPTSREVIAGMRGGVQRSVWESSAMGCAGSRHAVGEGVYERLGLLLKPCTDKEENDKGALPLLRCEKVTGGHMLEQLVAVSPLYCCVLPRGLLERALLSALPCSHRSGGWAHAGAAGQAAIQHAAARSRA